MPSTIRRERKWKHLEKVWQYAHRFDAYAWLWNSKYALQKVGLSLRILGRIVTVLLLAEVIRGQNHVQSD